MFLHHAEEGDAEDIAGDSFAEADGEGVIEERGREAVADARFLPSDERADEDGVAEHGRQRRRPIHLHVMVSEEELALIRERMAEAGVRNLGAYVRKMALNGYVLHVDLSDVRELVSLQRRCSNNLNQVAIQANTYGGIYPEEIKALQRDYETLWEPLSDLLKKLSAVVEL